MCKTPENYSFAFSGKLLFYIIYIILELCVIELRSGKTRNIVVKFCLSDIYLHHSIEPALAKLVN